MLAAETDPKQRSQATGVPMDEGDLASDIEPDKIPEATLARAEFLARQGFFGRASASLNCAALAPATEATFTKLRNLHPHGSGIACTALPANAPAWTPFSSQEIRSALSGISRGSSGGPSRVARDHILPLIRTPGMGDLLVDLLTRRANELITSPDTPITNFFFSARLIPLAKKDKGVRPVAVGELLRRLAAKAISRRHAPAIGKILALDGQVGVGVAGGIEGMFHATQQYVATNMGGSDAILKFDVRNAFNSVSRESMWTAMEQLVRDSPHFMDLLRYLISAYGQPTSLFCGGEVIASEEGAQQGDPLASLYFAVVFTQAVSKASRLTPVIDLPLRASFLDDLVVGGPTADLEVFTERLGVQFAAVGLSLNSSKCEVITHPDHPATAFEAMGFKPLTTASFELVGAPCGTNLSLLDTKVRGVKAKLDQFRALPSVHLGFLLARFCGTFPLLSYWIRLLGAEGEDHWIEADAITLHFMVSLVGALSPEAKAMVHLPTSHGGLGLRCCSGPLSSAALYASLTEALPIVRQLTFVAPDATSLVFADTLHHYLGDIGLQMENLPTSKIQKAISTQIFLIELQQFMANEAIPNRTKNILTAVNNSLGNHWLSPNFDLVSTVELPPASFLAWCRFRLGLPLSPEPRLCLSNGCKVMCDVFGDHTLSCMRGGEKQTWHALLEKEVHRLASLALWHPRREVHPFPEHPSRRLDIALPHGTARMNHQLLIDVAITNKGLSHVGSVQKPSGWAAEDVATNDKVRLYGPMVDPDSQLLLPLVFETLGATTSDGAKFIKQLARAVLSRCEVSAGLTYVPLHIGSTITRCVAHRLAKQFALTVVPEGPSIATVPDDDGVVTDTCPSNGSTSSSCSTADLSVISFPVEEEDEEGLGVDVARPDSAEAVVGRGECDATPVVERPHSLSTI